MSELRATRETARVLGFAIEHFDVESDDDFEPAFAAIAASKCDGLIAFPDALKNFNRQKIVSFAMRRRLPSIYGWKMYAEAGGLMSYGPVLDDVSVRVAVYVDKILKGAKPAEICRLSRRPSWRWWSTSKRRRRSGLKYRLA